MTRSRTKKNGKSKGTLTKKKKRILTVTVAKAKK
jgi:hypothetical protein